MRYLASQGSLITLRLQGVLLLAGCSGLSKDAYVNFRKMIQCALERQDDRTARELFNKMSDVGKAAPLTRFLMFKVALRSGDTEFGTPTSSIS
jgi:hypothetical protein